MFIPFFFKVKNYIKTKYNHIISPFYEAYYKRMNPNDNCLNTSERRENIVISLTSYPARFNTLDLCIKSIFNQSVKADKIVLYLDDFVLDSEIPSKIKELCKNGLTIKKIPHNLRSHKKYFFAMHEYTDSIIITFDDDVIYRKNTVKHLLNSYFKYPKCISAMRVHKITYSKNGAAEPYEKWKKEYRKITSPSFLLCATGVGGVLYPPHILPKDTFDTEAIKKHCYKADDIWLKFMELKSAVPVVWKKTRHVHPVEIALHRDTGLNLENVNKNQNDKYIKDMENFTGIHLDDWKSV